MDQNSDQPITLDSSFIKDVYWPIHFLLEFIRGASSNLTKEPMSEDQLEKVERILEYTHIIHWNLSDWWVIQSAAGDLSPSPPDQTTTVLEETFDKDSRFGFQNTELGKELFRECPDLLQLTLCYRELNNVLLVIRRLFDLLDLLHEHGSLITFQSSTEIGEKFNIIRLQIDCRNENLLHIRENKVFSISLPTLDRGSWIKFVSGFEIAIAKYILNHIGGDLLSEKEGEQLEMVLLIPSLKEGKPDFLTSIFPKDFPPDPKSSG